MTDPIAVVGGGIAGASVAYHLGERTDAPVTVYERGEVGAETTAKSTATLRLAGDPTVLAMKRDGVELYNRLLRAPRSDATFESTGRVVAATDDMGAEALRDADAPTGTYLSGVELSRTVVFPRLDTTAVSGALSLDAGYFDPRELAREFAERARAVGVEFRTETRVIDIHADDGRVTAVETPAGTDPVDRVVAAAGPWTRAVGRLVGLDLPLRHTLAPIRRLEPTGSVQTLPNLKHRGTGVYFTGRANGSVLVGHSPGGYHDAGTEYNPDAVPAAVPDDVASTMEAVTGTLLPSLTDAPVTEEWVGVRSLTPDGLPVVGPTAVEGFSVVAFNSEGVQLAPAAGQCIAARVVGENLPDYATAVAPSRFAADGNVGTDR
jgi:glycine/D-amino acid oxidase-like deaminating enzyme